MLDVMEAQMMDVKTMQATALAAGHQQQEAHRFQHSKLEVVEAPIAMEVPVALVYNGISHAVMMASPIDLEDFAYGFSFTEGIIDKASQIYDCEWSANEHGYSLEITIANENFMRLKEKKRSLSGRTGCGLCGVESLSQAVRPTVPLTSHAQFQVTAVSTAVAAMRERQALLQLTGTTHAAAWCQSDGQIEMIREDVGRHNAVDKIIGAALRMQKNPNNSFLAITSRASYEMVQKTAIAGIPLLAAVSGVTSLAVETATQSALTLIGFTRGPDLSIYSHPHRILLETT